MHKQKIDMSDEIYVINVGGYIGESTKKEIEYAKARGKEVSFMENKVEWHGKAPNEEQYKQAMEELEN